MADEQVQAPVALTQEQVSEALQKQAWGMTADDTHVPEQQQGNNQQQQEQPKPQPVNEPEEEVIDVNEWLKREFEVEDVEVIKQEREAYKKLKETPPTPAEIQFANEQSKHLHELIREGKWKEANKILEQQEKIETYIAANVDATTAEDIIKLGMSLKYKDLSPKEIDYKFNKEFALPKEPVQAVDELDTDFEARKAEWQEKVNDIQTNKIIEAKLMRPELEKLKTQLVLPEISKKDAQPQNQPTQEDLEADKRLKETFLKNAENSVKNLNGLSTSVKDKDVDLSINYGVSPEQKAALSQKMTAFAESGFNANALLAERWVNADMTINTDQIAKDLLLLENQGDILQKSATEAANQRLEAYIKGKKNVNLSGVQNGGDFKPDGDKSHAQRLQDFFWNN